MKGFKMVKSFVASALIVCGFAAGAADGTVNMLYLGNSMTWHGIKSEIGWGGEGQAGGEWGMAATAPEKDYAHLTSAAYGEWCGRTPITRAVNIAMWEQNYTGYNVQLALANEIQFVSTAEVAVVVFAVGENIGAWDATTFKTSFKNLVKTFTDILGESAKTQAVVRSEFWRNNTRAAVMKEVADELGILFVDAGPIGDVAANRWTGRADSPFSHAGVAMHPSDDGMKALADAIVAKLTYVAPEEPEEPEDTVTRVGDYEEVDGIGEVTDQSVLMSEGDTVRRLSNGEFVHTFTQSGSLWVPEGKDVTVQYLLVGGGGGGGNLMAGGGGAGEVVVGSIKLKSSQTIAVTVGAGGEGNATAGKDGFPGQSSMLTDGTITDLTLASARGGGLGAGWSGAANRVGGTGGSGGGSSGHDVAGGTALGVYAHNGGASLNFAAGGGGGAGSAGHDGEPSGKGGDGGDGVVCAITGVDVVYATGGGAGGSSGHSEPPISRPASDPGEGGSGGVNGGRGCTSGARTNCDGLVNTGAGGGGGAWSGSTVMVGGRGGSGIVVLRYSTNDVEEAEVEDPAVLTEYQIGDFDGGRQDTCPADESIGGSAATARGEGGEWARLACGDYVHKFTESGSFVAPEGEGNMTIHYLVVAGGGAGGWFLGGGGGGGGVKSGTLVARPGELFAITVGAGGDNYPNGPTRAGGNGGDSVLINTRYNVRAHGGGGGASWPGGGAAGEEIGRDGGSGGGGSSACASGKGIPGEGYDGGNNVGGGEYQCGGGGACGVGAKGIPGAAGGGGNGYLSAIDGVLSAYGAGGGAGGGHQAGAYGRGGSQGYPGCGGNGKPSSTPRGQNPASSCGANGYGSGGGGANWPSNAQTFGAPGGRGCVILRYASEAAHSEKAITISVEPNGLTVVSPAVGRAIYTAGNVVPMSAPKYVPVGDVCYICTGWSLEHFADGAWQEDDSDTTNEFDFTVPTSSIDEYRFRWLYEVDQTIAYLDIQPVGPEAVAIDVEPIIVQGTWRWYTKGTVVTLTASIVSGTEKTVFRDWYVSGAKVTENPLTLTVAEPKTIRAYLDSPWIYANGTITDGYWTFGASGPADAIVIGGLASGCANYNTIDFSKPVWCGEDLGTFVTMDQLSCYSKSASGYIKEVIFADSITNIMNSAFNDCKTLETVRLPANLEFIADGAFHLNSNLKTVTPLFPKKTVVSSAAFTGCTKLEGDLVIWTKRQTKMLTHKTASLGVFTQTAISSADFSRTAITEMGVYCFYQCPNLGDVSLPKTVTLMSSATLHGCNSLSNIVFRSFPKDGFGGDVFGANNKYGQFGRRLVYPRGDPDWQAYMDDPERKFVAWKDAGNATNTYLSIFHDGLKPVGYLVHGADSRFGNTTLWMVPKCFDGTMLLLR